jgi:hypothetical protein
MKRRQRAIVLLLLSVGAALLGWTFSRYLQPPSILLADGSRLELYGVSVGTNCSYSYGTALQRMARRVPFGLGQRFAGPTVGYPGFRGPTNIFFWFVRRAASTDGRFATHFATEVPSRGGENGESLMLVSEDSVFDGFRPVRLRFSLKDDHGRGEPGLGKPRETDLPSGSRALFWGAETVPRESPTLVLWVYDRPKNAGLKKLGEFRLPNPFYRKQP